jgi:hypothetical protein
MEPSGVEEPAERIAETCTFLKLPPRNTEAVPEEERPVITTGLCAIYE